MADAFLSFVRDGRVRVVVEDGSVDPIDEPRSLTEAEYVALLPQRMEAGADELNDALAGVLPEGVRFEWNLPDDALRQAEQIELRRESRAQ